MENKHIQQFFHPLCRILLVVCIYRSVNYWDLLSTDLSMIYISPSAVMCSCSYALPFKKNLKGVCSCHISVCAELRSISPADLFHYQPKLQMEEGFTPQKQSFVLLTKYARYRVHFKTKGHVSKTE